MFAAEIYTQRRAKLMLEVGEGLILLLGNEHSPMNYTDNVYSFRQDSSFLYFTGLDHPGLAAVFDAQSGQTTLFGKDPTLDDIIWTGPQSTLAEMVQAAGLEHWQDFSTLADTLKQAQQSGRNIHFLPPYRGENKIRLYQFLGLPFEAQKNAASTALIRAVIRQRSHKQSNEIAEMELAIKTSRAMYLAVMKQCKPGMTEAQLVGVASGIAQASGGAQAYPIILTNQGQVLHNHHYTHTLKAGEMVLADMGAASPRHYASDFTRTFPVAGQFSSQQKEIYQIVLDAQEKAISLLRPGLRHLDVHLEAAKTIVEGLKTLGLMRGDTQEAVALGAHALFFPHGLGHMIGLDVHDMEDLGEDLVGYDEDVHRSTQFGLKSLRLAKELEAGFVITVEPGVYFIPDYTYPISSITAPCGAGGTSRGYALRTMC
jgi:Xaa-Pro aminopeptidase